MSNTNSDVSSGALTDSTDSYDECDTLVTSLAENTSVPVQKTAEPVDVIDALPELELAALPEDVPACASGDGEANQCACGGGCPGSSHEAGFETGDSGDIADAVGCRVQLSGPMQFFLANGHNPAVGDMVLVETEAGQGVGEVVFARPMNIACLKTETTPKPRKVLGAARPEDVERAQDNLPLIEEARNFCRDCIRERQLDMNLVEVEVALDRGKVVFFFTAPSRIDFRELVKDLVRKFRTRIELRQIGVRHETQMIGAVGNCGMVCCCRRYLRNFAPVAIKMAKEQNVFLNPAKISGICGRLLCCLAYEQENYDEFYRRCPKLGKKYHTTRGIMRVLRASMFRESVSVLNEMNEELEFTLEDWKALEPRRPDGNANQQRTENIVVPGEQKRDSRVEQKGNGRNRDKPNGRLQRGPRPEAKPDVLPEAAPKSNTPDVTVDTLPESPVDTLVVQNEVQSAPAPVRQRPSAPVRPVSSVPSVVAEEKVNDMDDGDDDEGGSIFGLSPKAAPRPQGQQSRQDGQGNNENRDRNGARDGRRGQPQQQRRMPPKDTR